MILKNSFFYFSARIITSIFSFLGAVILARYLGASNYGTYGFAVTIGNIAAIFINMGARNYITREAIKKKNIQDFIANLFGLRFLIMICLELVLFLYISLSNFDDLTNLTLVIVVNTIFINSLLMVFFALNRAKQAYTIEIINQIAVSLLTFSGYYMILTNGGQLKHIIFWLLSLSILQYVIVGLLTYRLYHVKMFQLLSRFRIRGVISILRECAPFLIASSLATIFTGLDKVMLRYMTASANVGYYYSSYRIIESCQYLPDAFIYILFPVLIKKFLSDKARFFLHYKQLFKFMLLVSIPMVIGLFFYSNQIIVLAFKKGFLPAGAVLRLLSLTIILIFFNFLNGNIIVTLHKEKQLTINTGISGGLNLILNLILIPLYQERGAAMAMIGSQFLLFCLHFSVIGRYYSFKVMNLMDFVKFMVLVTLFLSIIKFYFIENMFLALPVYAVIYFMLIFIFQIINKQEIISLKNLHHQ